MITYIVFQKFINHWPKNSFILIFIFICMLTIFLDWNQLFISIYSFNSAFFCLAIISLFFGFIYLLGIRVSSKFWMLLLVIALFLPTLVFYNIYSIFPPSGTCVISLSFNTCSISPSTYLIWKTIFSSFWIRQLVLKLLRIQSKRKRLFF